MATKCRRMPASGSTLPALVEQLPNTPAIVVDSIGDIVHFNLLAGEVFSEFAIRDNIVRMAFLDPAAGSCPEAWRDQARDALETLRRAHLQSPSDHAIGDLLSELLRLSEPFRRMWMQPDRTAGNRATRVFRHREVGTLMLDEVVLSSAEELGRSVLVYVPTPGSVSDESLRILGSLCASGRRPPRLHQLASGSHLSTSRDLRTAGTDAISQRQQPRLADAAGFGLIHDKLLTGRAHHLEGMELDDDISDDFMPE